MSYVKPHHKEIIHRLKRVYPSGKRGQFVKEKNYLFLQFLGIINQIHFFHLKYIFFD